MRDNKGQRWKERKEKGRKRKGLVLLAKQPKKKGPKDNES